MNISPNIVSARFLRSFCGEKFLLRLVYAEPQKRFSAALLRFFCAYSLAGAHRTGSRGRPHAPAVQASSGSPQASAPIPFPGLVRMNEQITVPQGTPIAHALRGLHVWAVPAAHTSRRRGGQEFLFCVAGTCESE